MIYTVNSVIYLSNKLRVEAGHQSECLFLLIALVLLCFSVGPCIHDLCFRIEGEEVLEFLGDKSKANEEDASLVIAQLVEALCYFHRQNVVHLDIRVSKKGGKMT